MRRSKLDKKEEIEQIKPVLILSLTHGYIYFFLDGPLPPHHATEKTKLFHSG